MKNRNLISGVFFLVIGVIVGIYAITYVTRRKRIPWSWFFAILNGHRLVLLSLILLSLRLKMAHSSNKQTEKILPEKNSFKKITLSIFGINLIWPMH